MWKLLGIPILLGISPFAGAHALPGDTPLARQLEHVLTAPHHVVTLVMLLLALGLVIAVARAMSNRGQQ